MYIIPKSYLNFKTIFHIFSFFLIFHLIYPFPLLRALYLLHCRLVFGKEPYEVIAVDPDFVSLCPPCFIKDQFNPVVEVYFLNIIDIFLSAVAGMPHIPDDISRGYRIALL